MRRVDPRWLVQRLNDRAETLLGQARKAAASGDRYYAKSLLKEADQTMRVLREVAAGLPART